MKASRLVRESWRWLLIAGTIRAVAPLSLPAQDLPPVPIYGPANVPPAPKIPDLKECASLTQYGITWTFHRPARTGRFINGDWYVVGPVTIVAIDPKPVFGNEVTSPPFDSTKKTGVHESDSKDLRARNGSTLNLPAVVTPLRPGGRDRMSGFDSRMENGTYDAKQFTRLPIAMKPGDSLVSSISSDKEENFPIQSVAILTCVAEPQPVDAFRPSFCQTATCKPYLARNLQRQLLLKLLRPASAATIKPRDYAGAGYFQEPWIDNVGYGRSMPRKKFQFWGPNIAELVGGCSLLLQLDYAPAEKEPLLLGMAQTGIDLFGLLRGGGGWGAEGGYGAGRKWLITFAGLMLGDPQMSDLRKSYPEGRWHEDEQTIFCPVVYDGKTIGHGWTGARAVWTGHFGSPHGKFPKQWENGYGPTDLFPPSQWPMLWPVGSEEYRRNSTSAHWVAQALAARLMHAEKLWDYDAFFAYVDRWMTEDDRPFIQAIEKNIEASTAAPPIVAEAKARLAKARRAGTVSDGVRGFGLLVKDLWDTYRNRLPPAADGSKVPPASETWR